MVLFELRTDDNIYLTQDMAQALIADITRAIEEAKDHGFVFPVSLIAENENVCFDAANTLTLWIHAD